MDEKQVKVVAHRYAVLVGFIVLLALMFIAFTLSADLRKLEKRVEQLEHKER